VRLAGLIDWGRFEAEIGPLYTDAIGRPGLPTQLMVGLHLLKHMDGLSDEAVCARYLDSPYAQLFCGETYFQHALPLDRSSLTRWRQRIEPERLELLLAETLATAERAGAVEEKHLRRVTIDTTVQPKAVTHPTDRALVHRSCRSPQDRLRFLPRRGRESTACRDGGHEAGRGGGTRCGTGLPTTGGWRAEATSLCGCRPRPSPAGGRRPGVTPSPTRRSPRR
jgi:IS5 family transposase